MGGNFTPANTSTHTLPHSAVKPIVARSPLWRPGLATRRTMCEGSVLFAGVFVRAQSVMAAVRGRPSGLPVQ